MTKILRVSGYEPFQHQERVDTTLHIEGRPPEKIGMDDAISWYKDQATIVCEALYKLPQGTVHQVLINLLEHRAEYYKGGIS